MAKYAAEGPLFIGSVYIAVGQTFESDLPPGRKWSPLDDAARKAVARRDAKAAPPETAVGDRKESGIDIPADWEQMSQSRKINLARRLGAPVKGTGTPEAERIIREAIARRTPAAA